jgi:tetratricopeptide (TPR) repeat protein
MSGLTYLDLDLMFTRGERGYRVQVLRSPAGDGQLAVFDEPFTELELENFALKVGRFRARTRRVESAPVAAAKDVGSRLYNAVFADAVHECLRRSLDHARDQNAQLRIRLRLSDCPELANLPWELLYDQGDDWFIALSNATPVVRYIQLPDPPRALHVALPLRVLVIRSEPTDYPRLDLDGEWSQVTDALRELTDAGAIDFTELASPTMSDLRRVLQRGSFHVLHYMGHGGFDEQHGGVLLFADRTGRSVPVTAGDLGVLLRDHSSMRLAVLNACEGARTDPADPFAGVAETLVRRGIPAVVAMQFEFSDDAAIEFAPALYGALAAGLPVDAAVSEARKAVYTVSPLEWATPVLYLRAADGQLFEITQDTPDPPGEQQPDPRVDTGKPSARGHAGPTAEQHLAQADFFCEHQRYAEAETAYRTAIALDTSSARSYAGLAAALRGLQRHAEADFAYQVAVQLDPSLPPVRRNPWLTQVYASARKAEDSGDWGTAIAEYSRIIQADSAYQDVQIRLNNCQRQHVASRPPGQQTTTTGAQGPSPGEGGGNSPTSEADTKAVSRATIVIRREGGKVAYSARAFQLIVDGNKAGTIRAGERSEFAVASGTHRIKLRVDYLSSPELVVALSTGERASFVCGIARLGTLIKLERL